MEVYASQQKFSFSDSRLLYKVRIDLKHIRSLKY